MVKGLDDVVQIATGWHHAMALKQDGSVWMWGNNPYGQLGLGDFMKRLHPAKLTHLPKIKEIACGSWHSMAIDQNGKVWTWGRNENGMLGNGNEENSTLPVQIDLEQIKRIGAGCFQSLAINQNDEVLVWGENWNGQLGIGNYDRIHHPMKALIHLNGQIKVSESLKENLHPEASVHFFGPPPVTSAEVLGSTLAEQVKLFVRYNEKFLLSFILNIFLIGSLLKIKKEVRQL